MEASMFNFSTVMFNAQPHNLCSHHISFPLTISPLRFQSLQFPAKRNEHSQKNRNCVAFDDDIFENDTVLLNDNNNPKPKAGSGKKVTPIKRENLVPDKWREAQAETKITINERRKQKNRRKMVPFRGSEKIKFNGTVEKKRKENGKVSSPYQDVNWNEYKASKKEILKKLNPLVLKNPSRFPVDEKVPEPDFNGERVEPKNPRGVVQGKNLEDVLQFFDKWLPLHTFAACGECFLLDSLLKHNVDINAVDKVGLTVLHKAIGKKQAITSYLLRNSANPFVQDKEGATLMHYAVQTGSTETIELLLFYNVDINLQDKDGWTPLHLAVQTQKPNVVRLLLLKGADKTLRNKVLIVDFLH
ncbi:hypothetical protein LR48_Vigan499s006100 [Vigna angularis]|uniref:Uncharacterized protein n=1 Tax=Phaseolus angularis TaxID=3914 RepID=A0A0L9TC74_PHAAN|nr:hypothetical protein LR48_Vigan499s006100 [Vigna angularis]